MQAGSAEPLNVELADFDSFRGFRKTAYLMTFTIATNEYRGGGNAERTEYHPCVAWVSRPVRRAAVVGTALSPITPRTVDGTEFPPLWGELAWQLGGAKGFGVADADRQAVPPGADALRALLADHAPVVILGPRARRLRPGQPGVRVGQSTTAATFGHQTGCHGIRDRITGAISLGLPRS